MPGFAQKTAPVAKARAKTPSALSLRRSCGNQSTTQSAQNEREHSERGLAGTALDFTRLPAHSDSLPVQKRSVAQHDARRRDDERNECGPVVVSAPDRPRVVPSPAASNTAWVQRMCAACREEEKKVRACRTPRVQPKLLVGEDDDVHEREADRIAEKV